MKSMIKGSGLGVTLRSNTVLTTALAAAVALTSVVPAYATLDNTATVSGTSPTGGTVTDDDTVNVDLIDDDAELTIAKAAVISTDGDIDGSGDVGDIVTYTYTVTNSGNTSMTGVSVSDTHEGSAPLATPTIDATSANGTTGASTVDLLPGEIAIFSVDYTITADDILNGGGGATVDNDIDNSAVAEGLYPTDSTDPTIGDNITSAPSVASVPLDIEPSLVVDKVAYEGGLPPALGGVGTVIGADVPAGTVITYVYEITNDGDVPIESIGVSDVHNGTGTFTQPGFNSIVNTSTLSLNDDSIDGDPTLVDVLYPGDVAYYTTTYTVTQTDVDTLQ